MWAQGQLPSAQATDWPWCTRCPTASADQFCWKRNQARWPHGCGLGGLLVQLQRPWFSWSLSEVTISNSSGHSISNSKNLLPTCLLQVGSFLSYIQLLFNSSKNILFNICGFAFPLVSFMACPTKNPKALSFPAL